MKNGKVVMLALVVVLVAIFVTGWWFIQRGFSARDQPAAIETFIARTARRLATPANMKNAKNPFTGTPEVLTEGRAHFADHCAVCHANNGSGQTTMGQGMYPKPPDLRLAQTQELTDGEIYSIIHNGIRLTGMPAWGDANNDPDSWRLVLFIRHLPKLTEQEEKDMEALNPKSPHEIEEDREEEEFLNGDQSTAGNKRTERPKTHH